MEKYAIGLFIIAMLLSGCGSNQSKQTKNTEQIETKAHVHADGEECDGDHAEGDTHAHAEGEAHNHAEGDTHAHAEGEAHNHAEGEECEEDAHADTDADDHDHVEGEECDGDVAGEHSDDEIIFSTEQAAITGMKVYTVKPSAFTDVIKTSGEIESAQGDEAIIVATSNGIISFANQSIIAGTAVAEGATIVTISAKNLPDGDASTRAKISYEIALKEYQRAKDLVLDQIISAKDFEQITSRYESAKIAFDAQALNVTDKGVKVVSPINGYIINRLVSQGEYVTVGQPIATLSQNKNLLLKAEVSESNYNRLKTISSANFVTSYNNEVYKLSNLDGRLLSFGKASDKTSFYIPVIFEFNNTGDIIPGSFVEVYLLSTPQENVISIPVSSLTEEQGVYFVYVQTGLEVFKKKEVQIGQSNGEKVRILSGLSSGEKVVSKGAYQVKLAANSSVIPEGHTH